MMVDDEINISECGIESVILNAYMNAKSNTKKFQFGKEKCHKLHVGCKNENCPELYLDTWKIQTTDEFNTGRTTLTDVIDDEHIEDYQGNNSYADNEYEIIEDDDNIGG